MRLPLGAPTAQPGPRATPFAKGRGAPGGHARRRRGGRVPRARAGGGGGVSRGRRRRRRRGLGARRSLLCWNVRLPRARGAAAEQAPPRPRATDPGGGGGGGRDRRARAGGLSTLCSLTPGPSRASTSPAPNFSIHPHPSPPETPATKKSSRRRSGDAGSPAPPRLGRPVSAAQCWGLGRGGGGPAGRRRRRRRQWQGEGAEGLRARRCPGLICRYCGSGGGRSAGRGRAAERDRVTPARPGGWAGGVLGERRGARTPSPIEAGPPPARGPGRPSSRVLRSGVAWGPGPETSSLSS